MMQRLSSVGRAVLVERKVDDNRDVWVIEVEHAVPRRLTFDEGDDGVAIFSPDGSRVVHATGGNREFFEVHERRVDGQRFLVTAVVSEASPITVILNWKAPRSSNGVSHRIVDTSLEES